MPAGPEHIINRRCEIIQPCARNDDGVPPAVRFLGDAQKLSALVLAEFEVKPLPFDLNFFRLENTVHFKHRLELTGFIGRIGSKFYLGSRSASSLAGAASTAMALFGAGFSPTVPTFYCRSVDNREVNLPLERINPRHKNTQAITH